MEYAVLNDGIKIPMTELYLNDNDLASCVGKEVKEVQKHLRQMEKDVNAKKFILKYGGRSTSLQGYKSWLLWYDSQKYKSNKETFRGV